MENYLKLCYYPILSTSPRGQSNATFKVWYNHDFGLCFEYLILSGFLGALFGIASAYYAGIKRTKFQRRKKSPVVLVRGCVSFCILVAFVVDFVGSFWLSKSRPYSVVLSLVILIISWSMHLIYIWTLSQSVSHHGRGPLNLVAIWILTFVGSILQLRTIIRWKIHEEQYQQSSLPIKQAYFSNLSEIIVYIYFSLQCLYSLTLFFKVSHVSGDNVRLYAADYQTNLQVSDDIEDSVRENLISSKFQTGYVQSTYGSINASHDRRLTQVMDLPKKIDSSEDTANPLSCLSFWWVEPLMIRGSLGLLRTSKDLFHLPKSLETTNLRKRFQRMHGISMHGFDDDTYGSEEQACINKANLKREGNDGSEYVGKRRNDALTKDETDSDDDKEVWYDSLILNLKGDGSSATEQIKSQKRRRKKYTSRTSDREVSLFKSLNRAFGFHYYPLGILKLLADMLGFAGPLLLHALVSFMENRTEPISHGYYYALGLFLSTLLGAILNTHFNYQVNKVGLKIRGAVITEIYRKALSVSSTTLSEFSTGQVVNFMSTDSDRIVNFGASFHQFWSLPFQVIVSLALLYQQVGLAFLAGLAFCLLLIPVNRWLAVKIGKLSMEMMAQKDQRVKVMSELLAGIRVIKFYAWENNFIRKILGLRAAELRSLKGRKYLDALCVYFWATTPVLISILTFTTYVAMGHTLTAAKVFTSIALFNILISPLNAFPWVINGLMEAWVSTKRVNAFLQLKELDLLEYYNEKNGYRVIDVKPKDRQDLARDNGACVDDRKVSASSSITDVENLTEESGNLCQSHSSRSNDSVACALSIRRGCFTWTREDELTDMPASDDSQRHINVEEVTNYHESSERFQWNLSDVNLTIKPGQFVGVVGKVGSGKSSLLSAITAEMRKTYGEVKVADLRDGFGLFTQESWIQHSTLKDNILFGKPFNDAKYRAVISATALDQDMGILPAGDETEVGENGVTLSGGQKARVALARAIYQDKSIYLLDDPLAAVDAHVASHLYHRCINGLLKHKTRILCTHHIRFLQGADLILYMENGRIRSCGSPEAVLPILVEQQLFVNSDHEANKGASYHGSHNEEITTSSEHAMESIEHKPEAVLVKEEEKAVGVVSFSVYHAYWSAVGYVLAPVILLSLLLMQASRNVSDWWLAYWITHTATSSNTSAYKVTSAYNVTTALQNTSDPSANATSDDLAFYLGIYGGLAASNSIFTLFRAFLYAYGGICAAMVIHKRLLHSILMAPTFFFDTTPIGRIVNRFSSDIYAIDDSLPFIMNILLAQLYGLLGTLVITCYGLPWFTILLLPLALFYYNIQKFYRRTSRELKRLSTVTLSPIYAHFSETLSGLCTIRAMRASTRFMRDNEAKLEVNQRANYGSFAVAQWLGIRLQMLGVAMVAGVSFIAVLEHHFNTVNPGLVGLSISYALSVTNLLSGVVTSFTETEKEMVSVERAMQYIKGTPTEKRDGEIQPPLNWPCQGVVEFKNVVLTYREGLPSALKEVSFITKPGEKIGVVGRTGAGKSSLFKALFRMVELSIGSISIDAVNIASIPLDRLRSAMAIIPQDPFLFSGSLRENIDPCNKHTDAELWFVLRQCHLEEAVRTQGGLNCEVEEKGRVFSVGQRQLVCLARALLTQARVICIDEATASVDQHTDTKIQKTIRSEFTSSTVITIAHRIETVLNSDRILVMEHGLIKEFASPRELLDNRDSLFSSLLSEHFRNTGSK